MMTQENRSKPQVRIVSRARCTMQAGMRKQGVWVLEFVDSSSFGPEPLMGWTGGGNTKTQPSLMFSSLKEALTYAQAEGLHVLGAPEAEVEDARMTSAVQPKSYAENYGRKRKIVWTH